MLYCEKRKIFLWSDYGGDLMNQEKLQNSAAWSEESERKRKIFLFSLDVCNIVAVGLKAQLTRNIPQKVKLNAKSLLFRLLVQKRKKSPFKNPSSARVR